MDQYFGKLEELVFKEKYTIRPIHLIDLFGLHIKQAQFLLECFAEKHQNLLVKYGLIGHQDEPGESDGLVGARRYILAEKDEIENEKKKFTKLISCTIKSIKEKENSLNLEHPDAHDLITTQEDLIKYQKKGYVINEKTAIRTDKLDALLKRMGVNRDAFKDQKLKPITTSSTTPKTPVKEAIKAIKVDNKPKPNIFSSFKAAANRLKEQPKEQPKEEPKEEPKANGFAAEDAMDDEEFEEEFVKLKNGKSKQSKEKKRFSRVMKALADSSEEDEMEADELDGAEMDDQDEPIYKRRNGSQQIKRSKTIDSDSEEENVHSKENIKHKNKKQKRKRVELFSEHSSSDEQPAEVERKPIRPPQEEASSELVEEQETYIDEEGFKVTRMVKKIRKDEKSETPVKPAEDKQESKSIGKPVSKTNNKSGKAKAETSPPAEGKKSTAKSKPLPKNQTSIMSFFKPKTQSN